jgi:magnesium transporter
VIDVVTIYVHRDGTTERAPSLDRSWLNPASGAVVWVDLAEPSIPESLILSDTFAFHPLSVEDAMSSLQYPKVEAYDGYLYVVLHGIDFAASQQGFGTHDVDFFLGGNYVVTVHSGTSRSIDELREHATRNTHIVGDGPVALFHRIVDAMVDHYRPELDKLDARLDEIEDEVFEAPSQELAREILEQKHEVARLRRVTLPQRDVMGRLARREFVDISTEMAFRFRDVYDNLVRIADDTLIFHDRLSGMLEAYLSHVSNRLNEVMRLLTVVATIFIPLTLLSGIYGMNVMLPAFPGGGGAQFWWLLGIMVVAVVAMLVVFRRKRWI